MASEQQTEDRLARAGEQWRAAEPRSTVHGAVGTPARRRSTWAVALAAGAAVLVAVLVPVAVVRDDPSRPAVPGSATRPTEGTSTVTMLGKPKTYDGQGTQTVDLGTAPKGTTALRLNLLCLTPGYFEYESGAVSCNDQDMVIHEQHPERATALLKLPNYVTRSAGKTTTTVTAAPNLRWRIGVAFVKIKTVPWGVNQDGLTFGSRAMPSTPDYKKIPDLIPAQATSNRWGWAYTETGAERAKVTGDALGRVYESDGRTVVGDLFATNTYGLTVGTPFIDVAAKPDLFPSTNAEGLSGFQRWSDTEPTPGQTLEEMARQSRELIDKNGYVYAHLYAADGKTIIGKVLVGRVSQG